jgi:hypothetical protein
MKKLFFFLTYLIFCKLNSFAQGPNWLWAKSTGGNNLEIGQSIDIDASGNTYIGGSFSSDSITFDNITLINKGSSDLFIAKYDSLGNVIWAKSYGGSDGEAIVSIAVDSIGNSFVTGSFRSDTIIFDNTTLINSSGGNNDIFIIKYDPSGSEIWAKSVGGNDKDKGNGIALDNNGNCYVTGIFASDSISFSNITLFNSNPSYQDIFVIKYDSMGNIVWAKGVKGNMDDIGVSIAADANGNCYLTGGFQSDSIFFDNIFLINKGGLGALDIFIAKYDSIGNVSWVNSDGGVGFDYGYSIVSDDDGNCCMVGILLNDSITFGNTVLTTVGSSDFFIVKYDMFGNVIWAKSAGGINEDYVCDIDVDISGNNYVTGWFNSSSISFGSVSLTNNGISGSSNAFIAKYDQDGNIIWAKNSGGNSGVSNSIVINNSGKSYITGSFYDSPAIFGSTILNNVGNGDIFIAQLNSNLVGIEESNKEEGIFVYPNPASQKLMVNCYSFIGNNITLEIYNILGEKVFSLPSFLLSHSSPLIEIGVSKFPKGIYFLQVISEEKKYSQKIVIE